MDASTGTKLHLLHVYDIADPKDVLLLPAETRAEFSRYHRRVRLVALDQLQQLSESMSHTVEYIKQFIDAVHGVCDPCHQPMPVRARFPAAARRPGHPDRR